ncbi:MAG: acyl carrier protein [Eubacteriales bacterium]|nr:acyl carrier protein [Eubacteriales bacterium]
MAVTDKNEIEQLVRNEISRLTKKDGNAVDPDLHLGAGLDMDSLYMLEMYAMIETTFGVMIPTDRLQFMNTINKIVNTIVEFQEMEKK